MNRNLRYVVFCGMILTASILTGCRKPMPEPLRVPTVEKDYHKPLPAGELALRKVTDVSHLPDFAAAYDNRAGLLAAVKHSLNYLAKPSSRAFYPYGTIGHSRVVASLKEFLEILQTAKSGIELDAMILSRFDIYESRGCDDDGTVLYTGYYCPIFNASLKQTSTFRYPLYKRPKDLVTDPRGRVKGRRLPDGTLQPGYYTRKQIEDAKVLAGSELIWLADPFENYVVTVQGSAKLRLPDGKLVEVGYAGTNGLTYKSVGRLLVRDGKLTSKDLSLQGMIRYFKAHPQDVDKYCWRNPRYTFFRESRGGPFGCLNEPVIAFRTIATDKDIYPRAALAFIDTNVPRSWGGKIYMYPMRAFVLDQDAGGAIRAPGRCDLFMGVGDTAGELAGRTYAEGRLFYLFLKQRFLSKN